MKVRKFTLKALVLFLTVAMIWMGAAPAPQVMAAPAAAGAVGMAITPAAVSTTAGSEFTVSVQVMAGSQAVDTVQASLDFDPTYLNVVSVAPGGSLPTPLQNTYDNANGTIDFSAGALPPAVAPSGTFTLCQITFRAVGGSSGTTVTFHNVAPRASDAFYQGNSVINSGALTYTTVVSDGGGSPAATVTPAPTAVASTGSGAVAISLNPASRSVALNEQFTMNIQVAAGTQAVDTVQASLNFNPALLRVVSITPGGSLGTVLQNTYNNTNGTLDFGAGALPPATAPSGTFTLATVTFQGLANTSGTPISFNSAAPRETGAFYQGTSYYAAGSAAGATVAVGGGISPTPVPTYAPYPYPNTWWPWYYANFPTFSVVSVAADSTVTVQTYNFPANQTFTVRMGEYGTLGIGGIVVATINSGAGGMFQATFNVPPALYGRYRIAIRMDGNWGGYYAYNWFYNNTANPGWDGGGYYYGIPTFSVLSVARDQSVTVQTSNLPPNQTFTVRMGAYGSLGIGGIVVGTFNSGTGGAQQLTYNIPDQLKGSYQVAIRMDTPGGYYAYNWFYNNTTGSGWSGGYYGIPTFSITSVVRDSQVTILTNNLPPNQTFTVRMGPYGTLGINGIVVGTTNSGAGGAMTLTYPIPDALKGSYQIAVRMDSQTGYYYAYNWFYNN